MAETENKDPNIANEQGHTHYPKWITDKDGKRRIVDNAMEEKQHSSEEEVEVKEPKKPKGWDK